MSEILKLRGISGREGPKHKGDGLGLTISQMSDPKSSASLITMNNVHNCSLYELRQTLIGRGEFKDDYQGDINFEILLARMISIIGEETAQADANRMKSDEDARNLGAVKEDGSVESLSEKLSRQKLERKQEAETRSKQRQADKAYFKAKEDENVALEEKKSKKMEEKKAEIAAIDGDKPKSSAEPGSLEEAEEGEEGGEGGGADDEEDVDPFKLKYRSRIGGKYA
jgi:hypothetical protein